MEKNWEVGYLYVFLVVSTEYSKSPNYLGRCSVSHYQDMFGDIHENKSPKTQLDLSTKLNMLSFCTVQRRLVHNNQDETNNIR